MSLDDVDIVNIRDNLHNLDLTNPEHLKFYKMLRRRFIIAAEEARTHAYDDKTSKTLKPGQPVQGKITVGSRTHACLLW